MLAVGGMLLALGRWVPRSRWYEGVWLFAVACCIWLLLTGDFPLQTPLEGATSMWIADPFAQAGNSLALVIGVLFGVGSFGIRSVRDRTAERLGFLSVLVAGIMLVGSANDLLSLAISIEIVQLASWSIRKIGTLEVQSPQEGSVAAPDPDQSGGSFRWLRIATSCALWLGIAFLANVAGSTSFEQIREVLSDAYVPGAGWVVIGKASKLGLLAIGLIVAGLGSRLGLVPWQLVWTEEIRGTNYWTAGCTLLGGQLAGWLGLARVCGSVGIGYRDEILVLLLVIAGLTAAVSGSLTGLGLIRGEGRFRRWLTSLPMLHGAWLSLGLIAVTADLAVPIHGLSAAGGQPGSLGLCLFAMAAAQIGYAGLFLILSYLSRDDREVEFVDELLGLYQLQPLTATALLVLLASLIGQPPLWGFWANWLIAVAAFNIRSAGTSESVLPHSGVILLVAFVVIATLMAVAACVQCARIVLLEKPIAQTVPCGRRSALLVSCGCALALVVFGIAPGRLLSLLSRVHGHDLKLGPDTPTRSGRGNATAQWDAASIRFDTIVSGRPLGRD